MTTTEPHPALAHRCPFCHVVPGQPCRTHRGRGAEIDRLHSQRVAIVNDWMRKRRTPIEQTALCCECGHARTVKNTYWFSYKDENRSCDTMDHPLGWRVTGTLKCSNCGTKTRHALLREDDKYRDNMERQQYVALGGMPLDDREDVERLRNEYRAHLPRNPNLRHFFNTAAADEARSRGETQMPALCGDIRPVPRSLSGTSSSDQVQPDRIDWDTEFEDPNTGLWWVDMDCVNCLRITNERRRARRREDLEYLLAWFAANPDRIDDKYVDELWGHLERMAEPLREK